MQLQRGVKEAARLLWQRLLPPEAPRPQVSALAFVQEVQTFPDHLRIHFDRARVEAWLRAHQVPFFARPLAVALDLQVFGDGALAASLREKVAAAARAWGVALAPTGEPLSVELVVGEPWQIRVDGGPWQPLAGPDPMREAVEVVVQTLAGRRRLAEAASEAGASVWVELEVLREANLVAQAVWEEAVRNTPGVRALWPKLLSRARRRYAVELEAPEAAERLAQALAREGWTLRREDAHWWLQ